MPRDIGNRSRWVLKGSQILRKSWQIGPRALQAAARAQGCFRNVFLEHPVISIFGVLATLGWFLVPLWSPFDFEGVPTSTIQKTKKGRKGKGGPRNGFIFLFDWFLMPKWAAWNETKEIFALYSLQIRRFRRSRKLIERGVPKVIQNKLKWKPLATSGSIFEILAGFRNKTFLDVLLIGKK